MDLLRAGEEASSVGGRILGSLSMRGRGCHVYNWQFLLQKRVSLSTKLEILVQMFLFSSLPHVEITLAICPHNQNIGLLQLLLLACAHRAKFAQITPTQHLYSILPNLPPCTNTHQLLVHHLLVPVHCRHWLLDKRFRGGHSLTDPGQEGSTSPTCVSGPRSVQKKTFVPHECSFRIEQISCVQDKETEKKMTNRTREKKCFFPLPRNIVPSHCSWQVAL